MGMRKGYLLVLLCVLTLAGCQDAEVFSGISSTTAIVTSPAITSAPEILSSTVQENELLNEISTLKAKNEDLEATISKYHNDDLSYLENDPTRTLLDKYPFLVNFTSIQKWESITISSRDGSVIIADPEILEMAGNLFMISQESTSVTNGPDFNVDPFSVTLTNSAGTYLIDVVDQGIITFPELAQGVYFDKSFFYDFYNFGEAFMKKPSYVPVDSMESRMLNSGIIYIKEEKYNYYYPKSRGHLIYIQFHEAIKKKISKPAVLPAKTLEDITFLLYGNKIQMKVYPEHIQIIDGKQITWYKVDKKLALDIHAEISAN